MLDLKTYTQHVRDVLAEHSLSEKVIDMSQIPALRLTGMSPWEAVALLA